MRLHAWTAVLMVLALPGCIGGEEEAGGREIAVLDNSFEPMTATAAVGEKFEFENAGAVRHTVTIHRPPDPGTTYKFDKVLEPGGEIGFTFDAPGTYHVFCRFHGSIGGGMHLNVTVS